jgi:outer membrane scaffolding protein for murein synthesis (MipA/OmpV family)
MMPRRPIALFAPFSLGAGLLAVSLPAAAQTPPPPTWSSQYLGTGTSISLGAGAMVGPAYEGSDEFKFTPVPIIDVNGLFNDRVFLSTQRGIGVNALKSGPFTAGFSVNYSLGRDSDDADRLDGMSTIDGAAALSGFFKYDLKPFSFDATVTNRFGDDNGITVKLGAQYAYSPHRDWRFSAGPSLTWADGNYTDSFFGISSSEAARATARGNALTAYNPGAGFKDVGFTVSASYQISEGWSLRSMAGVSVLLGDAADSPLVEREIQPRFMLGLAYRF